MAVGRIDPTPRSCGCSGLLGGAVSGGGARRWNDQCGLLWVPTSGSQKSVWVHQARILRPGLFMGLENPPRPEEYTRLYDVRRGSAILGSVFERQQD